MQQQYPNYMVGNNGMQNPGSQQRMTPQQQQMLFQQPFYARQLQQQQQMRIAQQQNLMNNPMMQNRMQMKPSMNQPQNIQNPQNMNAQNVNNQNMNNLRQNIFVQQRMPNNVRRSLPQQHQHQHIYQKKQQSNQNNQQPQSNINTNASINQSTNAQNINNNAIPKKEHSPPKLSGDVRKFQSKPPSKPSIEPPIEEEPAITTYKSLPYRPWANVSRSQSGQISNSIRILSWNVLPKNAMYRNKLLRGNYKAYQTIPNYYAMNYRKDMLVNEILRNQPDIFCLQCVDQISFFQEVFAPKGFCSIFEQTNCPAYAGATVYWGDGLAIFWQTKKFDLIGYKKYSLGDPNYVANIALVARLKRRNINELSIDYEIDIWNTHFIEGMTAKDEYRRVKQCEIFFDCIANASETDILEDIITEKNEKNSLFMKLSKFPKETEIDDENTIHTEKKEIEEHTPGKNIGLINNNNNEEEEENAVAIALTDLQNMFIERLQNRVKSWSKVSEIDEEEKKENTVKKKDMATIERNLGTQYDTGGTIYYNIDIKKAIPDTNAKSTEENKLKRPVIVCSDFNSTTIHDYKHGIYPYTYSYLTRKSRTTQANDLYQSCLRHLPPRKIYPWFLQSAYALGFCNDPPYTQYVRYWTISYAAELEKKRAEKEKLRGKYYETEDGKMKKNANAMLDFSNTKTIVRCSDVILFTPQNFRVLSLYSTVSPKWVEAHWNKCLPNQNYPSDHLMLGVTLEYVNPSTISKSTVPKVSKVVNKQISGGNVGGTGVPGAVSATAVQQQPYGQQVRMSGQYSQPVGVQSGQRGFYGGSQPISYQMPPPNVYPQTPNQQRFY